MNIFELTNPSKSDKEGISLPQIDANIKKAVTKGKLPEEAINEWDAPMNAYNKVKSGVNTVKNWGSNVAATAKNPLAAMSTSPNKNLTYQQKIAYQKNTQKAQRIASKAQKAWNAQVASYTQSLPDDAAKQRYLNKTDPKYKENLTAFVARVLLGDKYIPTLVNKKQITDIINKLSTPVGTQQNQQNQQNQQDQYSTSPEATQGLQNMRQYRRQMASMRNMKNQSYAANPPKPKPRTKTKPADYTDISEAATVSQNESALWTQLVQAAGVAQREVHDGRSQNQYEPQQQSNAQNQTAQTDDKTLTDMSKLIKQYGIESQQLNNLGIDIKQKSGYDGPLKSTGNALVDALLKSMGFELR